MALAKPQRARLVDQINTDVYGARKRVYVVETIPSCTPGEMGRANDVLIDPNDGKQKEVYTVIRECLKTWKQKQAELIFKDCGAGHFAHISKQMRVVFEFMGGCTLDGKECPEIFLDYDEYGSGTWKGSLSLLSGVATFEVFCQYNPGTDQIDWFITYSGCAYHGTAPLSPTCDAPLTWTTTGNAQFVACCGGFSLLPPGIITVQARAMPDRPARHIDFGKNQYGGDRAVWGIVEDCPETCNGSPGCCPGVTIDDRIVFTGFNVQVLTGGCPCGAVSFSPTSYAGCAQFTLASCPTSVTVCLVCQGYGNTEHTWKNYRLSVSTAGGTILIAPTSGSCGPLSVTFDNVPFQTATPYGVCTGTISVTVTRP